jgi:hypothetical protein
VSQDESYRRQLDERARNLNYWLLAAGVLLTLVLAQGIVLDFTVFQQVRAAAGEAEEAAESLVQRSAQLDSLLKQAEEEVEQIRIMSAQLASDRRADGQLDDWTLEMEEFLGDLGYERFETFGEDSQKDSQKLEKGQTATENVRLESGKEYRFVAVSEGVATRADLKALELRFVL